MRVAINGFGRIGRTVLRQILEDHPDVEVALINDIAPLETCSYLFRYDSVYGPYKGDVSNDKKSLTIDAIHIPFEGQDDLSRLDLAGIDVVLECTGRAASRDVARRGLDGGARNVLISGPSNAADVTCVLGLNADEMGDARIVSNASCTTNAICPLLARLPDFLHAHITTIHCYTGSQPTVDMPRSSLARSRAGAVSMVPTTTSATAQIERLMPQIEGRLSVTAVRVPSISVSAVDAVVTFADDVPDVEALAGGVIGLIHDPCVSSDMRRRPESLVIATPETRAVQGKQLRLFGWYDNEWGFSARMIDMARRMHARA